MVANPAPGGAGFAQHAVPLRVLLIEDDDGDAFLVQELLAEADADVVMERARSLADARRLIPGAACVLLDLGLPDARGLQALRWMLQHYPEAATVVLTGLTDEHLGEQAVRAGAQDYLVKGEVSGATLQRVIRYAMERRHGDETQRQLHTARINARENARLEHGLLPQPVLRDPRLRVSARCWAGGKQRLLGGDFYDVVEAADGWVHALIGDVCGHGPGEAALGVCLRVAWRALVLAGHPAEEVLATVQQVLEHEQQEEAMFATVCMLSVAPDRSSGMLRLAGHPAPLLVTPDETAFARSASSSTMLADLPPSSCATRFTVSAAALATAMPARVEPVNDIMSMPGCDDIASPTVGPSPLTRLNTPGGTPASCSTSANSMAFIGATSEGFRMTVQPAASAGATLQTIWLIGQFHGVMKPHTPTASLTIAVLPRVSSNL